LKGIHPTPAFGPPLAHFVDELLQSDLLTLLAPDEWLNVPYLFGREGFPSFFLKLQKRADFFIRQLPIGMPMTIEEGQEMADKPSFFD